jgi:hypothetical protein
MSGHLQDYAVLGVVIGGAGAGSVRNDLRPLMGRFVAEYAMDAAQAARSLRRVVLASDCPVLSRLSQSRFMQRIDPPTAGSLQQSLADVVAQVESRGSFRADAVVALPADVALRPGDLVDRCIAELLSRQCDAVASYCARREGEPAATATGSFDTGLQPDGGCFVIRRDALNAAKPEAPFCLLTAPGDVIRIRCERDLEVAGTALAQRGWSWPRRRMAA